MAVSDEFKQALKDGDLKEALKLALSEATELEITTWVRAANPYNITQPVPEKALPGYRMRTHIDVIEGDIETEVGSEFVGTGPYTDLREFHVQQIRESRDIVQQNLDNLQQLFIILSTTLKKLSDSQKAEGLQQSDRNALESSNPLTFE